MRKDKKTVDGDAVVSSKSSSLLLLEFAVDFSCCVVKGFPFLLLFLELLLFLLLFCNVCVYVWSCVLHKTNICQSEWSAKTNQFCPLWDIKCLCFQIMIINSSESPFLYLASDCQPIYNHLLRGRIASSSCWFHQSLPFFLSFSFYFWSEKKKKKRETCVSFLSRPYRRRTELGHCRNWMRHEECQTTAVWWCLKTVTTSTNIIIVVVIIFFWMCAAT